MYAAVLSPSQTESGRGLRSLSCAGRSMQSKGLGPPTLGPWLSLKSVIELRCAGGGGDDREPLEAPFPLTPALSLGEREDVWLR